MRTVKYADWQSRRMGNLTARAKLGTKGKASLKPRDQAERALLIKLDKAQLEAWQKTGRLMRIAPRRYKINTSVSA